MTDKAYTTVDLVIFGVHPCFLRFFYDLPTIHNTSAGEIFPDADCPVVYDQDRAGTESPHRNRHRTSACLIRTITSGTICFRTSLAAGSPT